MLGVLLFLIMSRAMKYFKQVFQKYDDMNASVQENVTGIRVVKAYVREDHENKKFQKEKLTAEGYKDIVEFYKD